jgi:hypothetical protein
MENNSCWNVSINVFMQTCELPNLSGRHPLSPVTFLNIFLRIRGVFKKIKNLPPFHFKISCQLKNLPLFEVNSSSWALKKFTCMYMLCIKKDWMCKCHDLFPLQRSWGNDLRSCALYLSVCALEFRWALHHSKVHL